MDITYYRDNIKLQLTGDLLDLELEDSTIDKIINMSLVEIQRYICSTELATIPYTRCIDLNGMKDQFGNEVKISSVSRIFRTAGYTSSDVQDSTSGMVDPMYASQWQILSATGNLYNFQDYALNFASWNTLLQIRNTLSTDLAFRFDKAANKLYINTSSNPPSHITVEYVRRYDSVEEITSDYWIDILLQLSLAIAKVTVGRIRSRYTQSSALWTQDGETLLNEGNAELQAIREHLKANTQLVYGID